MRKSSVSKLVTDSVLVSNVNVNIYRTSWKDRFQRRSNISLTYPDPANPGATISTTTAYANIQGITEIHQGAELEVTANVHKMLTLTGMISYGDYYYKGNASGNQFTESNEQIGTDSQTLYLDKVKVGGTAQKTAAVGFIFKPTDWVSLDANYRGARDLYSNLTLTNFGTERAGQNGALELPSFGLVDLGLTLKIKLNDPKQFFTIRGNVYNLLDKTYIAESNTNILSNLTQEDFKTSTGANDTAAFAAYQATPTWNGVKQSNQVYFGYGRTWAATLSLSLIHI